VYRILHSQWISVFSVDAHVYRTAIMDWFTGGNPYRIAPHQELLFTYPPVFSHAGGAFARVLTPHVGSTVFLIGHYAAAAILPLVIHRSFLCKQKLYSSRALLAFLRGAGTSWLDSVGDWEHRYHLLCGRPSPRGSIEIPQNQPIKGYAF
jgi:hypothetical protein